MQIKTHWHHRASHKGTNQGHMILVVLPLGFSHVNRLLSVHAAVVHFPSRGLSKISTQSPPLSKYLRNKNNEINQIMNRMFCSRTKSSTGPSAEQSTAFRCRGRAVLRALNSSSDQHSVGSSLGLDDPLEDPHRLKTHLFLKWSYCLPGFGYCLV